MCIKTERKTFIPTHAVNTDWTKCDYSDSSITVAATFFPMSAIVKPNLEDRDDSKASMPECKNVETIAAIPRVWVLLTECSISPISPFYYSERANHERTVRTSPFFALISMVTTDPDFSAAGCGFPEYARSKNWLVQSCFSHQRNDKMERGNESEKSFEMTTTTSRAWSYV